MTEAILARTTEYPAEQKSFSFVRLFVRSFINFLLLLVFLPFAGEREGEHKALTSAERKSRSTRLGRE